MKTLRQTLLLLAIVAVGISAAAQEADPVIASIRQAYDKACQTIKRGDKNARNEMVSTLKYQVPGSGQVTETFRFFSRLEVFGENNEFTNYALYFVTRQYKIAGRKYYEEYLFNRNSTPIFVFKQGYDEAGKKTEKRLYYQNGTIYSVVGELTETYEAEISYAYATEFRQAFDNLIRNAKE